MTPLWGVLGWIWRRLGSAAFAPVTGWREMPAIYAYVMALPEIDATPVQATPINASAIVMEAING